MSTFLSEVVQCLLNEKDNLANYWCVLPSERASVFLKQEFKNQITSPTLLPEMLSIEHFIEQVSEMQKVDSVTLLFEFYTIYLQNTKTQKEDFEVFSQWATIALADFNEIDRHLVNADELFSYLKDIKRIENWDLNPGEPTEVISNHLTFMERLGDYYSFFYNYLLENKKGYQGLLYREAVNNLKFFFHNKPDLKIVFIGFNALNKAEEFIFKELLNQGVATVFWDSDTYYLNATKSAGAFLRSYKNEWNYYKNQPFSFEFSNFSKDKVIHQIAASKNVTQIKAVGDLLSKTANLQNTALVLADESLLSLTLNSLPENVEKLNITMGYSLKDMPVSGFFQSLFDLYINQEKLNKSKENSFYYKDVERLIQHPFFYKIFSFQDSENSIYKQLIKNNQVFVAADFFKIGAKEIQANKLLNKIFGIAQNASDFVNTCIELIEVNKNNFEGFEKECLFRFYNLFLQLQSLQNKYQHLKSIKMLQSIYKQLIATEKLSFQGEPLSGLQLMGMLETRVLDFETVIITSMNEGVLPAGKTENSFIPFDVKSSYGLPTYKEKDAIFSYHFYRLIQRAKNVYLLYNTENDAYGGGEKSRFLTQLEVDGFTMHKTIVAPKVPSFEKEFIEIPKTDAVIHKLQQLANSGFSPSALSTYVLDPIKYYKQYILGIKELDEVEETIAANTLGTVVHDVLEAFYKPFEDCFVEAANIEKMIAETADKTTFYFSKHFVNGNIHFGKNQLIFKVAENFVLKFLKQELAALKTGKKLKIIATEQKMEAALTIDQLPFPIKIKGTIDRIDELDGVTRIVDYKSGKVESNQLKIIDFSKVTEDYKYTKALQVMLYVYLYAANNPSIFAANLEAGIYSFRNLKSDFIRMDFGKARANDYQVTKEQVSDFMEVVKSMITEIFDKSIPFIENQNRPEFNK